MDRNTVIGFTLIFIIFLGWMYYMQPSPQDLERMKRERVLKDSLELLAQQGLATQPAFESKTKESSISQPEVSGVFGQNVYADTVLTTVDTDLYHLTFSNLGAGPVEVLLKQYNRWDGAPVQLLKDTLYAAYSLGFVTTENYNVETRGLLFTPVSSESIRLEGEASRQLRYELPVKDGRLIYTYTFFGNQYKIGLEINFEGSGTFVAGRKADFAFKSGLNVTEKYYAIEAKESSADLYAGDEHEKLMLTESGKQDLNATGAIEWVATKTKFFFPGN